MGGRRQRGGGKGKAQDVGFVRCISNNYNPLGLIMCHALCFYLIRIPPRDFGILAPFHGWGAGGPRKVELLAPKSQHAGDHVAGGGGSVLSGRL